MSAILYHVSHSRQHSQLKTIKSKCQSTLKTTTDFLHLHPAAQIFSKGLFIFLCKGGQARINYRVPAENAHKLGVVPHA